MSKQTAGTKLLCLFCGPKGKIFSKVEHVIPESLGNVAYVLTRVVCDKCNQYFSKLKNYFVHYYPTSSLRLFAVEKTKKGKPPMQQLVSGEMRRDSEGKITYNQSLIPGKEAEQFKIVCDQRGVTITSSCPLPDADAKKLSRFLAKCGVETLHIKRGNVALQYHNLTQYAGTHGMGILSRLFRSCGLTSLIEKRIYY